MLRNLFLLLMSCPFFVQGQTLSQLVDTRDEQVYETIQLDSLYWFRENLRYESPGAHCPNINRNSKHCTSANANFYPHQELEEVCPTGWRIPTVKEWEVYFKSIRQLQGIDDSSLTYRTWEGEDHALNIMITDTSKQLKLFSEDSPLQLNGSGWVQGKRLKKQTQMNMWIKHDEIADNRFHLHIGQRSYVLHAHDHHVNDKPRKNRKFLVRCVASVE